MAVHFARELRRVRDGDDLMGAVLEDKPNDLEVECQLVRGIW